MNVDGRAGLLVAGHVYDLSDLSGGRIPPDPMTALVSHWEEALGVQELGAFGGGRPEVSVRLGPPVPRPRSVYAIGINYRSHARELGVEPPPIPPVFTKFPSSITGPGDDIVVPEGATTTDWEAELAFVVGEGGRRVGADQALDRLRGFTVAQDVSERRVQEAAGNQYSLGKSFDTFCPLGPAVVTLDEVADPLDVPIRCWVNGHLVQEASTADMVVDVPHLVEILSSVMTLSPGDVCLTGTPSGVGFRRDPPVYLRPGDVVETEAEGVGRMRNACVAEAPPR